jgi:hypothetical protein
VATLTRENLAAEEAEAWQEYLQTSRDAACSNQFTYGEVEAWAWKRLQEKLLHIHRRRESR